MCKLDCIHQGGCICPGHNSTSLSARQVAQYQNTTVMAAVPPTRYPLPKALIPVQYPSPAPIGEPLLDPMAPCIEDEVFAEFASHSDDILSLASLHDPMYGSALWPHDTFNKNPDFWSELDDNEFEQRLWVIMASLSPGPIPNLSQKIHLNSNEVTTWLHLAYTVWRQSVLHVVLLLHGPSLRNPSLPPRFCNSWTECILLKTLVLTIFALIKLVLSFEPALAMELGICGKRQVNL